MPLNLNNQASAYEVAMNPLQELATVLWLATHHKRNQNHNSRIIVYITFHESYCVLLHILSHCTTYYTNIYIYVVSLNPLARYVFLPHTRSAYI